MSISINGITAAYSNMSAKLKNETKPMANAVHNYDAITISTSPQKEESRFASELSKAIAAQVKSPTPSEKVDAIKRQVDEGSYAISPQELASKLLLMNGGDNID